MNDSYYVLRGEIQQVEKKELLTNEKIEKAEEYKEVYNYLKKYKKLSPKEQKEFRKKHGKQLAKAEERPDYFDSTLGVGEKIDLKQWKKDLGNLNTLKMISNWKCDAFKDELGRAEL